MFFMDKTNKPISTGMTALVRDTDDRVLTHVSSKWNPVQNKQAFDFFDEFVNAGDMHMHTAGSLQDGKRIWALAKIQDGIKLFGKDDIENYLLFCNPHLHGASVQVKTTNIRVVCNNTLTASLDTASDVDVKFTHRTEFDPEVAKKAVFVAKERLQEFKTYAEFLGSKRYTEADVNACLQEIFKNHGSGKRIGKTAQQAYDILETQPGANIRPGTYWNVLNSVTYMTDHVLGKSTDARMASSWFGANARVKDKAVKKVLEYAQAA
jgi:phage/plasmid-like protein (TIGR03299 family)